MKAALFLSLIWLALLPRMGLADDGGSGVSTDKNAMVCYFDFAIQRITGIHEDEIAREGGISTS